MNMTLGKTRMCAMIVNRLVQSSSEFLDAFAKLRKTNIIFVMSVRPMDNSAPIGQIFMKFDI
jgi:DNA invertase Pin-like site-specific DNA recombinase